MQLRLVQFPRSQDHLTVIAVDPIAINVQIGEAVVEADLLDLTVGLTQRAIVPQTDVLQGGAVFRQRLHAQRLHLAKISLVGIIQVVGLARKLDVVFDVRGLAGNLVWLNDVTLHEARHYTDDDQPHRHPHADADEGQPKPAQDHVGQQRTSDDESKPKHCLQGRQLGVNVCIAGAKRDATRRIEQVEGSQPMPPGDDDKQGRSQR